MKYKNILVAVDGSEIIPDKLHELQNKMKILF